MYEWYFMYKDIVPEKTRKHNKKKHRNDTINQ